MQKLCVASCQFPVTEDVDRNAEYIGRYMEKAAAAGAHWGARDRAAARRDEGADREGDEGQGPRQSYANQRTLSQNAHT